MIGNNLIETKTLHKRNILLIGAIFGILSVVLLIFSLTFNGGILTYFSDDFCQYRFMMVNFVDQLKAGNLSAYDGHIFYGKTIESLNYYVPLDIFTAITFLLSFVVGSNVAYTISWLLVLIAGPIAFYCLFARLGYKPKTCLFASLIWVASGVSVFYNYPVYMEIIFYLPMTLLMIQKFGKEKRWMFTLWVFLLCLYNIYNAYCIVLGSLILTVVYNLVTQEKPKEHLKETILNPVFLGLFAILGMLLAGFVVMPSLYYMLNCINGTRGGNPTFVYFDSWKKYIYLIFNSIQPSAVPWIKGFVKDHNYIYAQGSMYITFFGFTALFEIFTMKTKKAKKLRVVLIVELICLLLPVVYYLMNASLATYSRWYFYPILMNIAIAAYVCDEEEYQIDLLTNKYYLGIFSTLIIGSIIFNFVFTDLIDQTTAILSTVGAVFVLISIIATVFKGSEPKTLKNFVWLEIGAALILTFAAPISSSLNGAPYKRIAEPITLSKVEGTTGNNPSEKLYIRTVEAQNGYQNLISKYTNSGEFYFDSAQSNEFVKYTKAFNGDSRELQTMNVDDGDVLSLMERGYDTIVAAKKDFEGYEYNFYEDELLYEKINETDYADVYKIKNSLPFVCYESEPKIVLEEGNLRNNYVKNKINLLSLTGENIDADVKVEKLEKKKIKEGTWMSPIYELVKDADEDTIFEISLFLDGDKRMPSMKNFTIVCAKPNIQTMDIDMIAYDLIANDFRKIKEKGTPMELIFTIDETFDNFDVLVTSYKFSTVKGYYENQKELTKKIECKYKNDKIIVRNNNEKKVNIILPLLNINNNWSESSNFYGMILYKMDANLTITSVYNVKYLTEGLYISLGASVIFTGVVIGSSIYNLSKKRKKESVQNEED